MFSFECCNPIWGRTTNPYNDGYTCGGSSGGEAALLSMDGAALGVGSDIGGSLRIPAAFCGIYSFKPSPLRISYVGAGGKILPVRPSFGVSDMFPHTQATVPGFEAITSVGGPMGRYVYTSSCASFPPKHHFKFGRRPRNLLSYHIRRSGPEPQPCSYFVSTASAAGEAPVWLLHR